MKKEITPLKELTALRESKGMSIRELADVSDNSEAFIRLIEKGERKPKPDRAVRIGAALGLSKTESYCFFYGS